MCVCRGPCASVRMGAPMARSIEHTGAESAARSLLDGSGLTASQVNILGPSDGEASNEAVLGRLVEPASARG